MKAVLLMYFKTHVTNQSILSASLFLLLSLPVFAQKEINFWILGQTMLDFNTNPPHLNQNFKIPASFGPNTATMADKNGQLLFYTNGKQVYTRNGTIMPNGNREVPGGRNSDREVKEVIIIPKPKKPLEYYIFTLSTVPSDHTIDYMEVDMRLNNGLGDVTNRFVVTGWGYPFSVSDFAVTGNCDQSAFYFIKNDDAYAIIYQISEIGISTQFPVNGLKLPHWSGGKSFFKVAPNANKIAWTHQNPNGNGYTVATFLNGIETSNAIYFENNIPGAQNYQIEFSSNSQVLYALEDKSATVRQLAQYDLRSGNPVTIKQSKFILAEFTNDTRQMQLAGNGKIYLKSDDSKSYLTVIQHPNMLGTGAAYDPTPLVIDTKPNPNIDLPDLISGYLGKYGSNRFPVDAGTDVTVCKGQPVVLGKPATDPAITYRWSPPQLLSDPNSSNPTFRYSLDLNDSVKIIQYTVTATYEACEITDTVNVKVYPLPLSAQITGARSVCPRVEGVVYRAAGAPGITYRWQVNGGIITAGQGTVNITVNWGTTNPHAWVEAVPVSKRGCAGPAARLPVRINVELIPETPRGPDSVCVNKSLGVRYQVFNTNNSVYTWFSQGGTIAAGQGTHQVQVNWSGEGIHRLWLQERSTTIDTVCLGTSDTLRITVYRDQTTLDLQYVSVSLTDETIVEAAWLSSDAHRLTGPLALNRRLPGATTWQTAASPATGLTTHPDPGRKTDEEIYEYQVTGVNGCEEPLISSVHNTVRLTGESREQTGTVNLTWNAYTGWPQGVTRYEIWRKLDQEPDLRKVGEVSGGTLQFNGTNGLDGFNHRFRIKAVAQGSSFFSWSNELELSFTHELTVPNIFTPNNDGRNDTFVIRRLELYPENQLTLYNRWGKEIYRTQNYRNTWNGQGLPAGIYHYSLMLHGSGKHLKGWVELVR